MPKFPHTATRGAAQTVEGVTYDGGPAWKPGQRHTGSDDLRALTDITDDPYSGNVLVCDDLVVSAGAAMRVQIIERNTGAVLAAFNLAQNSTVVLSPRGGLRAFSVDNRLQAIASAAGQIDITACWHSELPQ